MKACTKCGEIKSLSEYSFKRQKGRKEGYQPRCKICASKDTRDWYSENKEKAKDSTLKKLYGIGLNEYKAMLLSQNNQCLICGIEFKEGSFGSDSPVVDHCHTTGKVRGLLCNECNRGLGYFHDNQEALIRASKYLKGEL